VHAHPDDETLNNGATMARYAAEGARVVLVTCTRGELGQVIPPELGHLRHDRDGGLGGHRVRELADAMAALGVTDHRFLDELPAAAPGAPARYHDSGMVWLADGRAGPVPDPAEGAFALADVDVAAARLAALLREVRPQVLVTYEPGGGYGHPDHVQAHRVAHRAVELAARNRPGSPHAGGWSVPKVYWTVLPRDAVRERLRELEGRADLPFPVLAADGPLPSMAVPDELVTTAVDATAHLPAKEAALRAHTTQVVVRDGFWGLADGPGQPLTGVEHYRLAAGTPSGPFDGDGRERDLFAGT